jgi:hypothetical protein
MKNMKAIVSLSWKWCYERNENEENMYEREMANEILSIFQCQ